MRILYVTQSYFPESLAVERITRQAVALARLGHDVTVLTTMPSYPLGKIFPGYRGRFFMRETVDGVAIRRVWSLPAANTGFVRRALSYASFAIFAAIAGLFVRRPDVVMAAVPKPGTEVAGIVISRLRRVPLLLEMIDVLPENLPFIGVSERGLVYRILLIHYRIAYRLAHVIAVLCPAARDVIAEKGIDPRKIMLLPNAADPELLASTITPAAVRARHKLDGTFVALYAGSYSKYYRVPAIVEAAKRLREARPDVHFLLLGTGPQWTQVRDTIERERLDNVTLTGAVPRGELGGYFQTADLFLFSMVGEPTPRPYHGILTAKACDYLMVGRPILSIERGEILADRLRRLGAGDGITPDDPDVLAAQIVRYADDAELTRRAGAAAGAHGQTMLRDAVMANFVKELSLKLRERGLIRADARAPDDVKMRAEAAA